MSNLSWYSPLVRAYKGALDVNSVVTTKTELNALLTDPTSYAGMLVSCTSLNKIFMLNDTETGWIELSTNNINNLISVVDILPTPNVSIKDKYYLLSTDNKIYKCVEDVNNSNNYIFQEISSTGIQIVNNYNNLSSLPTKESIVYCKEDYVDTTNNKTYVNGFYLYDTILAEWVSINKSTNIKFDEITDNNVSASVTSSNDTLYSINAEKITQNIGIEKIEVVKSKEDMTLDDGTVISIGDVIEIHKFIDTIEIYSYCIVEDPLYNPFV